MTKTRTARSTTKRKPRRSASRRAAAAALDAVFRPRSVAVIGASRRKQTIGHEILSNLLAFEFNGPVYPVNTTAEVVHSIQAYPSVEAIPAAVDLAVVVVPRDHVPGVIEQCGRKGVRALVVITAGFKEVDEEGAGLERRLKQQIQKLGMRMIGPNCMGVINTEPGVRLNATFASAMAERGNVGFISQSGALGEAILADAADNGLGVAMFASMGNKTDISGNDLLEYWEDNDDVQVILMYLESFGNPVKFTQIARRVTRKKPIITVKAGRTAAGARAASSHTGSIVGLDIATESLLEQCGVLRVSSMEEMFVQAAALATQPVPAGDRIAVVTNAGGPAILCTDSLVARAIAESADGSKPVLSVFMGKQRGAEGSELLRAHRVPVYRFPEEAAAGMTALVRYRELRDRPQGKTVRFRVKRAAAAKVIAGARAAGRDELTPREVWRLLRAYGFPLAPSRAAFTAPDAIAAAQDLGYPVVIKALSEKISHKTDVGGVRVDLRNADEVGQAFRDITARVRRQDPEAGVTVQKLVPGGREVILGMARDAQFGPLIMFGLGGIFVEVMRDVSVRIHPLTDVGARLMIERLKGYPILAGHRGEKPVALGLLEQSLLRLSQLVADFEAELRELDLNPFIVTDDPERSFVVDARISLRAESAVR